MKKFSNKKIKNIRRMIDDLINKIWQVECLGHVMQNTLSGGEVAYEIEYGMLSDILNQKIKQVMRKVDRLDRYFMKCE